MVIKRSAQVSIVVARVLLILSTITLLTPLIMSQNTRISVSDAETYLPTMTFDVASIRESHPDPVKGFFVGGSFVGHTSLLRISNERVVNLLSKAFGVASYDVVELPDWAKYATFNLEARGDDDTDKKLSTLTEEQVTLEQQHMLQALLIERFHLKYHLSEKGQSIYNLVVAKGGAKVLTGGSLPPSDNDFKSFAGKKAPEVFQRGDGTDGYEYVGRNCPIASLAVVLGLVLRADVADKTGLSGTYDFNLRYSQASDSEREKNLKMYPPIKEALEAQLGLRLVAGKGSVPVLVVDEIKKPSAN